MTQYSRVHVFGQGPNYSDMIRQGGRAAKKTEWANKNPDKLLTADELYEAIRMMEENPPAPKKVVRRKRPVKKFDANVPTRKTRNRGRKRNRTKKEI